MRAVSAAGSREGYLSTLCATYTEPFARYGWMAVGLRFRQVGSGWGSRFLPSPIRVGLCRENGEGIVSRLPLKSKNPSSGTNTAHPGASRSETQADSCFCHAER